MANEITVEYLGKLRCQAHRAGAPGVQTDVDTSHGGLGENLSPVEMAIAALGTCTMSMVAVVGERSGVDLSSMRVETAFDMVAAPHRRIGAVRLTCHLPNSVPADMRPKLEMAAKTCPVKNSLNPDIEVVLEMKYEE